MSAIRIQSGARRSISRTFNGCGVSLSIGDPWKLLACSTTNSTCLSWYLLRQLISASEQRSFSVRQWLGLEVRAVWCWVGNAEPHRRAVQFFGAGGRCFGIVSNGAFLHQLRSYIFVVLSDPYYICVVSPKVL